MESEGKEDEAEEAGGHEDVWGRGWAGAGTRTCGCGDEDVQVRGRGGAAARQGQEDPPLKDGPDEGTGRTNAVAAAIMNDHSSYC